MRILCCILMLFAVGCSVSVEVKTKPECPSCSEDCKCPDCPEGCSENCNCGCKETK